MSRKKTLDTPIAFTGLPTTKGKAVYGDVHDHGDEYCAQHTLERWARWRFFSWA
jgi:hypothetical protein